MINLLVKNKSPLNATDTAGYTALHHAVAEGHGKFPYMLTRVENFCTLTLVATGDAAVALLKAGAEMDKKDGDGMLALDLAPDKEVCDY
jgi:26S proteasome non-ATPase regulatory subunit 10